MGQSSGAASDDAVTLLRKGDFTAALSLADQALKQNPHDCRMLTVRGLALKNSGKPTEAQQAFGTAASSCPKFLPALEGLAELQYAQHSPQAAATLEKMLLLQPDNQTTHA